VKHTPNYAPVLTGTDSPESFRGWGVESDVGELCFDREAFVAEKLFQRLIFIGNTIAMVGV
jgi:hypothetical protein